jgi:hypothetical protein
MPPAAEIRVPLTTMPTVGFVVYFQAPAGLLPPDEAEMFRAVYEYLEQHVPEPLRDGLRGYLEQGFIQLVPHDRETVPDPPDELVRAYNPGEIEERRWRSATHALYVGTTDLLIPPRIGLWATIVTARALAATLPGGVILDPEFPRLLSLRETNLELPNDGQIHVVDHIRRIFPPICCRLSTVSHSVSSKRRCASRQKRAISMRNRTIRPRNIFRFVPK